MQRANETGRQPACGRHRILLMQGRWNCDNKGVQPCHDNQSAGVVNDKCKNAVLNANLATLRHSATLRQSATDCNSTDIRHRQDVRQHSKPSAQVSPCNLALCHMHLSLHHVSTHHKPRPLAETGLPQQQLDQLWHLAACLDVGSVPSACTLLLPHAMLLCVGASEPEAKSFRFQHHNVPSFKGQRDRTLSMTALTSDDSNQHWPIGLHAK